MPRNRFGENSDRPDVFLERRKAREHAERMMLRSDDTAEPPLGSQDSDEASCCSFTLPPFLLKHAGKISIGFFVLGVALAVGAAIATGDILTGVLGASAAVSFVASIYFFKKAGDRDNDALISAWARSYDEPGLR